MQPRTSSFVVASIMASTALVAPLTAQGGRGGGRGGAGAAPAVVDSNPLFGVNPTFPTDDAVIKRIYANGMDSSWTKKLAHTFLDSLGPRLMGSDNLKAAQSWVLASYKSWGIEGKLEPFGTWRSWRRGYSHIDLISPRVRSLSGTMLGFSPGTGKKDVDMQTIILPLFKDSTEFVKWLPQAKGKLVMISPANTTCRLTTEIKQFGTPYTDSVYAAERQAAALDMSARVRSTGYSIGLGGGVLGMRLEEGGAGGIVTSRPKEQAGIAMEVFETYNTKAPAIALTCEDYGLLWRLTESNSKPVIRLNLDAEFQGEKPIANAIGTIRGTTKPDEVVMLSAHFDSWDGASGATDNGTGTLTMMEAMRILKKSYPNPKRTIMVGHWSGEEEGLIGSQAWSTDHPEINKKMQMFINQDNGTGRVSGVGGAGFIKAGTLIPSWIARMPSSFRANFRYSGNGQPWRGGSASTDTGSFTCDGVPALSVGGTSWNYGNLTWHTEKDTYDKVSFDDLKYNATIVAMLAYMAAEDPEFMTRNTPEQNAAIWAAADSAAAAARGGAAAGGRGGAAGGRGGAAGAAGRGNQPLTCAAPIRATPKRK